MDRPNRKSAARRGRRGDIFRRERLRPSQLRTVADRRYDDADCLRQTGLNARANGAMYLGGFVIECLLKAQLIARFPWLASAASPGGRSKQEQRIWSLCYRSHDLVEVLALLPDVGRHIGHSRHPHEQRLFQLLRAVCERWTIFARYSPRSASLNEAGQFLDQIRELKTWLR